MLEFKDIFGQVINKHDIVVYSYNCGPRLDYGVVLSNEEYENMTKDTAHDNCLYIMSHDNKTYLNFSKLEAENYLVKMNRNDNENASSINMNYY